MHYFQLICWKRPESRILCLLGCLCWGVSGSAWALRCGSDLVLEGMRKIEVLKRCGEPVLVDERVEYRTRHLGVTGQTRRQIAPGAQSSQGLQYDTEQHEAIVIEEWTYNFGRRRLMRFLRFENGVLKTIDALGYGYRSRD